MAFSVGRKVSARRRVRQALGIRGIGSVLPDIPSAKTVILHVLRQMLRRRPAKLRHYKRQMTLDQVPRYLKPMQMEIAQKALNHNVAYGMFGLLTQLTETAPVRTGTLVANYDLTTRQTTFNQYAAYFPKVIRGTYNENRSRSKPIERAYRNMAQLEKGGRTLKIVNPTPYFQYTPFYKEGIANRIERQGVRDLKQQIGRSTANYVAKLSRHGR